MQSSQQIYTAELLSAHAFKEPKKLDNGSKFVAIVPAIDVLVPRTRGPYGMSKYKDDANAKLTLPLNITDERVQEGLTAVEGFIKKHFQANPDLLGVESISDEMWEALSQHILVESKKAELPPQIKPKLKFKKDKVTPAFVHTGFIDEAEGYEPGSYQGCEFKTMLQLKGVLILNKKAFPSLTVGRVVVYEREQQMVKDFSDDEDTE